MCACVCVSFCSGRRGRQRGAERAKKAMGKSKPSARQTVFLCVGAAQKKKKKHGAPARARACPPMGPMDRFLVRRVVEAPASDPSLRPSPTTSGQGRAGGGGDGRGGESIESASDVGSLSPVSPLPPLGPPAASPGKHQQLDAPGTTVAPPVRRGALIG